MVVNNLKCLIILFSCIMLYDRMITWHMMMYLCIQLTWYPHVNYLTLICLYLTPDPRHLISDTGTWLLSPNTWYLIFDTWQLTWNHLLDMFSHGTSALDLILWHLTGLLLHPAPVLQCLFMIITFTGTWHNYYNTTIWYSWTPVYLDP